MDRLAKERLLDVKVKVLREVAGRMSDHMLVGMNMDCSGLVKRGIFIYFFFTQ